MSTSTSTLSLTHLPLASTNTPNITNNICLFTHIIRLSAVTHPRTPHPAPRRIDSSNFMHAYRSFTRVYECACPLIFPALGPETMRTTRSACVYFSSAVGACVRVRAFVRACATHSSPERVRVRVCVRCVRATARQNLWLERCTRPYGYDGHT